MNEKKKNIISYVLLLAAVPAAVIIGAAIFKGKHYAWISLCVAVLSCVPVFCAFEKRDVSSKELVVIAVLIALTAAGRFVFAWLPGFKPVTALTVISAIWLGKSSGFMIGSLSAVISNFYFGQGPWTPFQMFSWGIIGFIAGALSRPLKNNKAALCVYGVFSGVLFSLIMDVWTVLWADGYFNFTRYAAAIVSALPVTAEYAASNVVFLLLLSKPIGEKLKRIKEKYGLFASV